jgi:TorA maturation chaperone TorD
LLSEDYLGQNAISSDLRGFFKSHILVWIPQFCDVLYTAAQLDFYREVASGLKSYILWLE